MSEDNWEQRRRAIEAGARSGGAAGARRAEIAFNANQKQRRTLRQGTSQDDHDRFGRKWGRTKAAAMHMMWKSSFPRGTAYDRDFNTGQYKSKEQVFKEKGEASGFPPQMIKEFLKLG